MQYNYQLFRLRQANEILGYLRLYTNGRKNYSKDQFWWGGKPIEYTEKDMHAGISDRNNRPLFEKDIVLMRSSIQPEPKCKCQMMYDAEREAFILKELESENQYALFAGKIALIHKNELTFIGFTTD